MTVEAATERGLAADRVVAWHPLFWSSLPERRRAGKRAACVFHHYAFDHFDDPGIVAGVALNRSMLERLRASRPDKPVWLAETGGAENAVPHARRRHPTGRIRLLLVGNALAPMADEAGGQILKGVARKGAELILPIAERLDRDRFAWVFVGKGWDPWAAALERLGWTVIWPGEQEEPLHYATFGEGDVYLLLSRLEGGPLPLIEAMGLGIWPVATPVGVAPELVRPGETGHLLPAFAGDNGAEVAEAVAAHLSGLDREGLAARRAAVRAAVGHRTWAEFRRQVLGILAELEERGWRAEAAG